MDHDLEPCDGLLFDEALFNARLSPGFRPIRRGTTLEYWCADGLRLRVVKRGIYCDLYRRRPAVIEHPSVEGHSYK